MLSEYEKLRLANIARNQAVIKALGLDTAAAATKPVQATKKRARSDKAPAQAPTRGSRRLQGEAADEEGDDETAVVPRTVHQPLKRASREPYISPGLALSAVFGVAAATHPAADGSHAQAADGGPVSAAQCHGGGVGRAAQGR
jgi:hypothetical protein